MTSPEAGLFELPDRYRELQAEARALAASVAGIAAEAACEAGRFVRDSNPKL